MRFEPSPLDGVVVVRPEIVEDDRGGFARTWCLEEFARNGLPAQPLQCSVSYNRRRGTLRGMHYQVPPVEETKLVRCTRGAIFDVALDLRPGSPTFRKWFSAELTAENRLGLFIPAGCAHGFQTLLDDTEVFYQISQTYSPAHARGVRWDDPAFGIAWPPGERILSAQDRGYPDFDA